MPVRLLFLLCLLSFNLQAVPEIQTWKTKQGVPVYFVEAHQLPMLDVQVIFDAGSARDGGTPGLAAISSHLMSEGADGMSTDEISNAFESLGANFNTNATYDSASVSLRSLSEDAKLQKALKTMQAVISKPEFPEASFERERKRILIGIQAKKQNPGSLASEAFYATLYEGHPYATPTEGTEESLKAMTIADLKNFHNSYYVRNNAMVVLVGDISRKQAEKIALQLTADLPAGEKPAAIPTPAAITTAKLNHIEHPSTQTHILVGQPGVRRGDPDYFALYVGNHVLGGGGMISRLFKEVREKRGLSYSAYSYFSPMRVEGPFISGLQTRTDQTDEAITVLMENMQNFIKEGPTEAELEASKKNITGGFPMRIDSNSKILGYLAMIGFYGMPLDYLNTFNEKINAVTVADIKAAFKKRLQPENFVTVKVGPKPEQGAASDS